jgi:hypothetical protein
MQFVNYWSRSIFSVSQFVVAYEQNTQSGWVAMLWDIAIFALTVIGIRRKEMLRRTQLLSALVKQGTGYIFATILMAVPITASLL